jgi:hypothetical protein
MDLGPARIGPADHDTRDDQAGDDRGQRTGDASGRHTQLDAGREATYRDAARFVIGDDKAQLGRE